MQIPGDSGAPTAVIVPVGEIAGAQSRPSAEQAQVLPERALRLAVVVASVREGRLGAAVASWFSDEAKRHGRFDVDLIDLATASLPLGLTNDPPSELMDVTSRLESADAFVVVTPEYNHSFPASIKSLIDWHFSQWRAKPVGFVSYGGRSGGVRAVEALRLVLAEMHAVTIRDTVSFPMVWETFGDDGRPVDEEESAAAAQALLDQLAWWATALLQARTRSPYPAHA
ncbi:NADPH-dependent FMN reductase [Plantactinospora sonchi]|uniref:NAD(P)H-dependent oxidoreductase n=1 Tax=Plantactinospora sonchi TaxID=1544735 RepID=A0ABU7S266_9ACTN